MQLGLNNFDGGADNATMGGGHETIDVDNKGLSDPRTVGMGFAPRVGMADATGTICVKIVSLT